MTAYAARTRPGPPANGRYRLGDTVPDSNGVIWNCVKGGFAGANVFDPDGAVFVPNAGSTGAFLYGAGAASGATVSAAESGDGLIHKTVLTLTATPVTITDDAGVAQYGGTGKIYGFPEGLLFTLGAEVHGNLTLGTTGTIIDAFTGVNALGTATASTGATLVGTEADILQSTANATASSKVAAIDSVSTATALTESGARHLDGTGTAKDMYLNFAIADDATHTSGTGTFTGVVTVVWMIIADN